MIPVKVIKQDLGKTLKDSTVVQHQVLGDGMGRCALEIRRFKNNDGGLLCRFIVDNDHAVIPLSHEISKHIRHKFSEYVPVECVVSVGENRLKDFNAYVLVYFKDVDGIADSLDRMTKDILISLDDGIKSYNRKCDVGDKHQKMLNRLYMKMSEVRSSYRDRINLKLHPKRGSYQI